MDLSNLPPYDENTRGRQAVIDHAARIDKEPFVISVSIFFGAAVLCVITRFVVRIFGRLRTRLDDGLVLLSVIALASSYAACMQELNGLYLLEAINKHLVIPLPEELPEISSIQKWSTIFAALNWTSVYLVKFTFLYFFYILVQGLGRRIKTLYWITVGLCVVFWIYTVLDPVIICPHFGADSVKCETIPNRHARSLIGNVLVAIIDIVSDMLIVTLPILVLNRSMMPFARKLSVAAMLCLSVAMIAIALIRLVGTIVDTRPDGDGSAPAWSTYWSLIEACVSVIMTSVILIRGVFIANVIREDGHEGNILSQLGHRLLSTLRISRSSRSSRRSPRSSEEHRDIESHAPNIDKQKLPGNAFTNLSRFMRGSNGSCATSDDTFKSVDTAYVLENLEYHRVRKAEIGKNTVAVG
ncbi:hypothetical protein F5Y09DRAFT_322637 [Xylaria sp. FL1042]|nr:hypothetical protein F5Y09DRAFT_322637 [Xylaria sp. FL1042]